MWDREIYREQVNRLLIGLIWLSAPLCAVIAWGLGGPWEMVSAAALGVALLATGVWRLGVARAAARVTIAVALMGQISLALGAAAGGRWQVDIHMAYFAGVALIAVYCDPIALVAATATVALHHLTLNFALPEAVYPGGSDFVRVLLHAVILLIEAGGLIWMSAIINGAFDSAEAAGKRADQALVAAEAAARQAAEARVAERREAESRHAIQAQMSAEQSAATAVLAGRLAEIAEGDLTARISDALGEKYADIKTDFNAAIAKLQVALGAVNARTVSVRSGAMRFAEAAEALSSRSEQQASQISATVPALDRVGDLIKRSTDRAFAAREVVAGADSEAKLSGEIVGKAVQAMAAITDSSSRIGQIIGVIDEIAFQTNLLALNAGVEAARAGDSGRGFAVVASEVRALAQRSAQAAKEIKELISTSMEQVEAGAELVTGAGDALQRIAHKVSDINGVVGEIAASAKDQLAGVSEVHQALTAMDASTQQNLDMAREANRASRELANESDELGKLMRQFRVGDGPEAALPVRKRAEPSRPARRLKAVGDWSET